MIKHFIISVLAILLSAYFLPNVTTTLVGALILALVLGIINVTIKPILKIILLPVTILTLGLFSLILNALLILLAAKIVPGFEVTGFWAALLFGVVLSLVNLLFSPLKGSDN